MTEHFTPEFYYQETSHHDNGEELPFFVYGTLRPKDFNYVAHFQGRTAQELNGFYLPNAALYSLGRFPATLETSQADRKVWGDLIYIPPQIYSQLRVEIDALEWFTPGATDNWYWRVAREAVSPEGTKIRAWVYVATQTWFDTLPDPPQLIPPGDWLKYKDEG
jgi:gamma-glutamylcyclotransferase (GGCT)/AIG2-like uncharacterized protein YtfP